MASGKAYIITSVADIAAALTDKYGAGVTIHHSTTDGIIFSCAAISNKVIFITNYVHLYTRYGDAFDGSTNVTNPIDFGGDNYYSIPTQKLLLLADNSLLMYNNKPADANAGKLLIVSKLSNDNYIHLGATSYGGYSGGCKGYITPGNIDCNIVVPNGSILGGGGELYKTKIYVSSLLNVAQLNIDGSLAYLLDIEVSYSQYFEPVVTSEYVLAGVPKNLYVRSLDYSIKNNLLVELPVI